MAYRGQTDPRALRIITSEAPENTARHRVRVWRKRARTKPRMRTYTTYDDGSLPLANKSTVGNQS